MRLTETEEAARQFLLQHGIIRSTIQCVCTDTMTLRPCSATRSPDLHVFRCQTTSCRKTKSCRSDSYLSNPNLPFAKFIQLLFCFASKNLTLVDIAAYTAPVYPADLSGNGRALSWRRYRVLAELYLTNHDQFLAILSANSPYKKMEALCRDALLEPQNRARFEQLVAEKKILPPRAFKSVCVYIVHVHFISYFQFSKTLFSSRQARG